jgi:hypothetical protein
VTTVCYCCIACIACIATHLEGVIMPAESEAPIVNPEPNRLPATKVFDDVSGMQAHQNGQVADASARAADAGARALED